MPRYGSNLMATLKALVIPVVLQVVLGCGGSTTRPQPPANLAYPQTGVQGIAGQALAPVIPTVGGVIRSFSISPALPAGLIFDTSTGAINGTPTAPFQETTYTVTANNEAGSSSAKLQVVVAGLVPDLRFQWTGAFDSYQNDKFNLTLGTPPPGAQGLTVTYSGVFRWGPLSISSPTGDAWGCMGIGVGFPLIGGTRSSYSAAHMEVLDERLDAFTSQGMIITSLDLSVQGFGVVATGPLASATEYQSSRAVVGGPEALAALGAIQGQQGAVITALATLGKTYANAPGAGQILAHWSRRQSDSGTYEVQVVSGTPVELNERLPALGQQGYVITAFGAGDQQNYIAVGTRVTGTSAPHTIRVVGFGSPAGPTVQEGFVPIGRMSDLQQSKSYWVFQR